MEQNNMEQPIISIIIPMYNCSRTIVRCLNSIDASDAEIIVVDDGSTDNSLQVVSEYIQENVSDSENERFKVIHQDNGGVSSARNSGIEYAKGKYICFVDADDYLSIGGLDRIIAIAEKEEADIVTYVSYDFKEKDIPLVPVSVEKDSISYRVYTGRGEAFRTNLIPDYVCNNAIYRSHLIFDHKIRFKTDLVFREDDEFIGHFYCYAEKIVVTNLMLYNYIIDSSSSSTATKNKRRTLIESALKSIAYRQQNVRNNFYEVFPFERLKFMRYVCQPQEAIEAEYTLSEYRQVLNKFRELGCYPLDYKWIRVANVMDWSRRYCKMVVKTFLTNHPLIGLSVYKRK